MSAFSQTQQSETGKQYQQSNDVGINYIIVSPIESYLPKDYVKMILDETYCQIDLDGSVFIPNKKNENIEINGEINGELDESNIYYVGIMKINSYL
jgi:hypothetical protein